MAERTLYLGGSSSREGAGPQTVTAQGGQGCMREPQGLMRAHRKCPGKPGGQGGLLEAALGFEGRIEICQGAISPLFSTSPFFSETLSLQLSLLNLHPLPL